MAEYLSPGVYVEEFESGLRPMEGVGTSTAGFVGMAEKGSVIGTPEFVSSFADFTRKFGGYLSESAYGEYRYLAYSVEQFFANGGTRCYVMRVVPADAKRASLKLGTVSFNAKNPGKWGNEITITATPATKGKAAVVETIDGADGVKTYTLSNASGFAAGDTVAAVVNGKAVAYTKVASVQDNKITLAAALKEDMVDKNVVPKKQFVICECNLEIRYKDTIEVYEKVSLNGESASFIGKALSKSQIVDVEAAEPAEAVAIYSIFTDKADSQKAIVRLAGGEDGGKKGITDDIFMGVDNGPGKRTGLASFVELNNVSIMAIPGVTSPAVQLALCAQCANLGSRFAVLDLPLDVTKPQDALACREKIDSDYAAMYHPWVQIYDSLNKKPAYIPPSGAVCGIYARSDAERGVHKAPANEVIYNAIGLSCLYNKAEQDILNPAGVNLIRVLPGQGIRVWGARTCSSNTLWKYVNVRRLFIYLEESIKANTNWAVFEPNDTFLWTRVNSTISSFLRDMWRAGALVGESEAQAFFVNVGRDTMSQNDILNGRLICEIGVAPSRPAEFVIFRITQLMEEE
ncbi:MAG: phage tail sheath family protein [Suilimivivens sp.]